MSDPVLSAPGFFGKLPATGDFVRRRLPSDFVSFWDRWVSRYLARRPGFAPFCFLRAETLAGAMTGVVVPSRDRSGRAFPLTLAAACGAGAGLSAERPAWHAALLAAGEAAARGDLDADTLALRLETLAALPAAEIAPARGMLLWLPGQAAREVDPEAPGDVLDAFFATIAEVR